MDIAASVLAYPALGLAHLLAAIAVSVWASRLGGSAPISLPVAFALGMAAGWMLAVEEQPLLVMSDPMCWASVLVLTVAATFAVRMSLGEMLGLVALFGGFHGHALGEALGSF